MFGFLARLRPPRAAPAASYEIACSCGERLTGVRAATHQVARCPRCGRDAFVLPQSPLPPVTAPQEDRPAVPTPPQQRLSTVLIGLGLGLLLAVVVFGYVLRDFRLTVPPPHAAPTLPERRERGRDALADGNFQRAVIELRAALALADHTPALLSAAEHRQLRQLYQQSALLADLLRDPLETVVQLAGRTPAEEWQRVFARDYHNRAVVFDADVSRTQDGQYTIGHEVSDGRRPVRLYLEDVVLLRDLPLDRPRRLLFGVRLVDVVREPSGRWLIRFVPESGVLLTEPAAAKACLFAAVDEALIEVLERQARWIMTKAQ